MLTLETIPRVKAGCTIKGFADTSDPLKAERAALAQRAHDVLGYKALRADVTGERLVGASSGPLTEALLKLEMVVLDTGTVITYQLEELSRMNRAAIEENLNDYVAGWFTFASWQHTSLADYARPVPEFALDKAIRIKEVVPDVSFFIQHMSDPKADPFLVAKRGNEVYFVEAWDEPRFERSL